MASITRRAYADMYGPTVGDKVRLADTGLLIEVERAQPAIDRFAGVGVDRLVDAEAAERPILIGEDVAADPADLGGEVAVGDFLGSLGDRLDLFGRTPGVAAADGV